MAVFPKRVVLTASLDQVIEGTMRDKTTSTNSIEERVTVSALMVELRRVDPYSRESAPRVHPETPPPRGARPPAFDSPERPDLGEDGSSDECGRLSARRVQPRGAFDRRCASGGGSGAGQRDP